MPSPVRPPLARRAVERIRALCAHPAAGRRAVLLAVVIALPSLAFGLEADDHWLRASLVGHPRWGPGPRSPLSLFTFLDGVPAHTGWLIDQGIAPWWTDPNCRISFFRPLTAFTHWADVRLWPRAPWLWHAQSIAWFAATVAGAAALYRRVLGAGAVAGFAVLVYAADHTHAVAATWIANRSALVAAALGFAAVLAHDRARRQGGMDSVDDREYRPGRAFAWSAVAFAAFVAALLAGEGGLGAAGWLAAHAVFLDRSAPRSRAAAIAPYAVALAGWAAVYRAGGYGAHGSGMYVDPAADPLRFAATAARNAPLLAAAELGSIIPDLGFFAPAAGRAALLAAAVAFVALAAMALAPLVRARREAAFFALGAALAIVPSCGTTPSARLLLLPGFGLLGLVAMAAEGLVDRAGWLPARGARRAAAVSWIAWTACFHAFVSPVGFPGAAMQVGLIERAFERVAASVPDDASLPAQRIVVVNAPDVAFLGYLAAIRTTQGRPLPASLLGLAPGRRAVDIDRPNARSVRVRSEGGFLRDVTDGLMRDPDVRMPPGTRVVLSGLTVEVTAETDDARPAEAVFRFDAPLESESLRWMRYRSGRLEAWAPPAVGRAERLEAEPLFP